MDIGKEIKYKIDELIYTTGLTVELFEEYLNESYSYRDDFIKEFIRRTENGKWREYIRKKQFNLEVKETHIELDISPRYHEFWDSVGDDDVNFFIDIDNEVNYDTIAEKKWLDRKANEINEIYDLIKSSSKLGAQEVVKIKQNSSTTKKGLDSTESKFKIRLRDEYIDYKDFLDKLFLLLIQEEILSSKTKISDFKEIFTCNNILKSESKVYFSADRVMLSFFLPLVFKRVFDGINISQMQNSNCFFYNHETLFTSAAMYNGKSQSHRAGSDEKYADICNKILIEIKKIR